MSPPDQISGLSIALRTKDGDDLNETSPIITPEIMKFVHKFQCFRGRKHWRSLGVALWHTSLHTQTTARVQNGNHGTPEASGVVGISPSPAAACRRRTGCSSSFSQQRRKNSARSM